MKTAYSERQRRKVALYCTALFYAKSPYVSVRVYDFYCKLSISKVLLLLSTVVGCY
jgi:hypothetical protein